MKQSKQALNRFHDDVRSFASVDSAADTDSNWLICADKRSTVSVKSSISLKKSFTKYITSLFFLAAGCGSTASTGSAKVSINVWGLFDTNSTFQTDFIAAYQKQYPNVKITYTEKNVATYESDLINALAAGTGPDIFYIHNDWLPTYKDKLQPATAKEVALSDYNNAFADVASKDFVSGGQVYAVPLTIDTLVLYYNKDILGSFGIAEPPQTWNELAADAKKISEKDSTGYFNRSGVALGTTANINRAQDIMYLLMLQSGTMPFNSDYTRSTIDQAISGTSGNHNFPGATALSYFTSFSDSLSKSYDWNTKSDYSLDAFANGKLAMMYGYYYDQATILQKSPNLNIGVAPVPQPALDQNLVNYSNYWGYTVSKQSKVANWDWDFLKFISAKSQLEAYDKTVPQPSSRKDIIAEQVTDTKLGVVASSTLTAKSFYKPDVVKTDSIITNMIDDVSLRDKQVTDALSSASQQLTVLASKQNSN